MGSKYREGLFSFLLCYFIARKRNYPIALRVNWGVKLRATRDAFFALIMPLIILGGLVGGVVTPTETAVLAVVYAFLVGMAVFRELKFKDVPRVLAKSANTTSLVMIILAAAGIFGWLMAEQKAADGLIAFLVPLSDNPRVILVLIVISFLILGMFLDPIPAVIIFAPVVLPLILKLAVDPVFFGVLMVVTLMIGALTPPVGMTLYLVSSISESTIYEVAKQLLPFIVAYSILSFLLIFFPELVLFLPNLLMGKS